MPKVDRLFNGFKPVHYELSIEPDFKKLNFAGHLSLTGSLPKATKTLRLHARDLSINEATVGLLKAKLKTTKDQLTLSFTKTLPKGKLTVDLDFSGQIKTNMHGLYVSTFKYRSQQQQLLATQLEADHAREVFPCIDEPEAKATFSLNLKIPKKLTAISNMPVETEESVTDAKRVKFVTTPIMSTYLLAFVVGNIGFKESKTKNGTMVRVYATPENVKHTKYALDNAVKVLEFYNDFFKIPYPLPKLDMAALPDFAAGAMENWGLVTYREELLLVDAKNTSLMSKQYVMIVIAHELAHQWFGNLVTMRWWTDLWLNEGFASWVEYLAANQLYPEWDMWTQFVSNDYSVALAEDSLANTHPVEVPIEAPEEIQQVFDAISYQKGASVIRMLYDYLGGPAFQSGLAHYLKKHSYDNAETTDLWSALEEKTGKPVMDFMSKWTKQTGFPVISYQRSGKQFSFSQQRFILSPLERTNIKDKSVWPVPIDFVGSKDFYLLDKASQQFSAKKIGDWFKINSNEEGFYRTQYNPQDLAKLLDPIRNRQLPPEDRLGLLSDSFALTKAGIYDTEAMLYLLEAYRTEDDYAVWEIIASDLLQIARVFDTPQIESVLNPYAQAIAQPQADRLGWQIKPADKHFDRLLRPEVLGLELRFGNAEALESARALFTGHAKKAIHPDLRAVIYSGIARYGSSTDYQQLLKMYANTDMAEEKNRLAAALCNFRDVEHIQKNLAMIKSDKVRLQESPFWIGRLMLNKDAKHAAWQWLENNWQWFKANFGATYYYARVINYVGLAFADHDVAAEVEKFFAAHPSPAGKRPVNQALETIRMQAEWRKRDYDKTLSYLQRHVKP